MKIDIYLNLNTSMKYISLTIQSLMIFIALLTGTNLLGQIGSNAVPASIHDQKADFDQIYGLDPNLMNGIKYNYPYANIKGDPFLFQKEMTGNIQINGKTFPGEKIRFDILNNQVVLNYLDHSNNQQSIVLRNEWVDQFEIGEMQFKKVTLEENKDRFVQVIFEGDISCYYDWTKEHKLSSSSGSHYYYFADPVKTGILIKNGEELYFRTRMSFLKHFQREEKQRLKKYIKSEKIRFNKANSNEMKAILKYSNQL